VGVSAEGALECLVNFACHSLTSLQFRLRIYEQFKLMKITMNNEELRALNQKRKIYQIAWVTRDLEKSMKAWVENLKIGPWTVLTFTNQSLKYLKVDDKTVTEPFKFLIGISWIGDMQLELIEPVYGPTIYEAFIQKHGEGLHHIKERIADDAMEGVVQGYRDQGIGVTQTGQFETDFHYYLNTEPRLDFIYELGNCPKLELTPDKYWTYPVENA
jgi:Glyoxalase/Bleomycin resistance protein/Dioxygenase superfamily